MSYSLKPIGYIHSPFKQKFAIPRQSHALSLAKGSIEFCTELDPEQALDGIEQFSHLWLLFLFHENIEKGYANKVRPPRLGGNKKVGVFASRSTFRPNGIGMSLVTNLGVNNNQLHVAGIDLLDGTPIVDIKPYLPYADVAQNAHAGYAQALPSPALSVIFSDSAKLQLHTFSKQHSDFEALLVSVLAQDPRPAYKAGKNDPKIYHISLYNADIAWCVSDKKVLVKAIIEN